MAKHHNNKISLLDHQEDNVEELVEVVKVSKYVNCVSLNVRNEPSMNGNVVSQIHKGSEVEVLRHIDSEWDEIVAGNVYGYVVSKFLTDERR